MKPLKIYLATPYSHKQKSVSIRRYNTINEVAAKLISEGYIVYSPISHTHPITETGLLPDIADGTDKNNWTFWQEQDHPFLEWCDELWIYCAEGWLSSTGVQSEIGIAERLGKKVKYLKAGSV